MNRNPGQRLDLRLWRAAWWAHHKETRGIALTLVQALSAHRPTKRSPWIIRRISHRISHMVDGRSGARRHRRDRIDGLHPWGEFSAGDISMMDWEWGWRGSALRQAREILILKR
jgi:hypothetical protein